MSGSRSNVSRLHRLAYLFVGQIFCEPSPRIYAGKFLGPIKTITQSWGRCERGALDPSMPMLRMVVNVLDLDDETIGRLVTGDLMLRPDRVAEYRLMDVPVTRLEVGGLADLVAVPPALRMVRRPEPRADRRRRKMPTWYIGKIRREEAVANGRAEAQGIGTTISGVDWMSV